MVSNSVTSELTIISGLKYSFAHRQQRQTKDSSFGSLRPSFSEKEVDTGTLGLFHDSEL